MIEITVSTERDAILTARMLTRAANFIRDADAPEMPTIEQMGLIQDLCRLRDEITIAEPVAAGLGRTTE